MGFKRKFNVGERVVVKSTKEVGKVMDYYEREYAIDFGERLGWYRAEKLEKYEEEEPVVPKTDDSKEEDWRVGDEVVVVREFNKARLGLKGTVIYVEDEVPLVEFEVNMGGHDGSGRSEYGRCWWMNEYNRGLVKRIVKKCERAKMPILKTGMKVKLRDGRMGLVVENANISVGREQKFVIIMENAFCASEEYEGWKRKSGRDTLDIVSVYAKMTADGRAIISCDTLDVNDVRGYKEIWRVPTTKKITKKQAETELSEKHGVKVVIEG